jgi:NAD(P)-dependent dehydrogenase (short-subunit alcohol dehydrogenase family)
MSKEEQRVAIITGGSHGIGAGLVAAYRRRGWAVVANSRTIKLSEDPDLLAVDGDVSRSRPPIESSVKHSNASDASIPSSTTPASS